MNGVASKLDDYNVEVSELPIKKWTSEYKKFLEKLTVNTDEIDNIREYHENPHINFVITYKDRDFVR